MKNYESRSEQIAYHMRRMKCYFAKYEKWYHEIEEQKRMGNHSIETSLYRLLTQNLEGHHAHAVELFHLQRKVRTRS